MQHPSLIERLKFLYIFGLEKLFIEKFCSCSATNLLFVSDYEEFAIQYCIKMFCKGCSKNVVGFCVSNQQSLIFIYKGSSYHFGITERK